MSIIIRGESWGSAGSAYEVAKRRGALRLDFLLPYLKALYTDAALVGIRADILVAQADLETGSFRSIHWIRDGNPAGLAIFDDGSSWGLSFSPERAARAHVAHMCAYLGITPPQSFVDADKRWDAVEDAGYFGDVRTTADLGNGRWATDPLYGSKIESRHAQYSFTPPEKPMAITYSKVPLYGYVDRFIAAKRQGFGWDDLGPRNIKFITLHRMVGTLQGTDGYFRDPAISSYTDFGLSTKLSDPGLIAGTIYLWNYPSGRRAPWASGPVSAPYGDGKAIVDKYGINAVNRDGISLEIGGYNEVIDEASWKEIVWFIAYWADQCKVPHTSFPINPATGISFLVWHQEFTIGTGKKCPFQYLMDNTGRLIADVKSFMKRYQETTVAAPAPAPIPVPPVEEKIWKDPRPVAALANHSADTAGDIKIANGTHFRPVFDMVECIKQTPQFMYADDDATKREVIGPDLKPGERIMAAWRFTSGKGVEYYYTVNHARVYFNDFKRVQD